ncbi:hypothetical protein [Wielerella bovis]|uniref:hypothetical protein n=1 Tax=Wielerella bovis TaxID=2917790 RepID=UPI002018BBDF|nr:hypothetical protein [Wielerella bovis]ULJ64648.1 hypothetical protein MIS33_11065 [Wielerella bovis]ULJ66920.1 hypothetical protein MIS31_11955 [Wielerella bovis]
MLLNVWRSDFGAVNVRKVFTTFQPCKRRFGRTSEQLPTEQQRVNENKRIYSGLNLNQDKATAVYT